MAKEMRPADPGEDLPPEFVDQSPLLRQLFYERRFRVTLLVLLVVGIGGAAALGRVVPATPSGVEPRIRISGLDLIQAWSLARSAAALEAAGNPKDALVAWSAAAANHPGRPDLQRRVVDLLIRENPPDRRSLTNGLGRVGWLLALDGTNTVDLARAARLYRHHGFGDIALRVLEPHEDRLDPGTAALHLELLFAQNQFQRFGELWPRLPETTRADPRLRLHHQAWQAEWGPPGEQRGGEAALAAATADPDLRVLAHRLRLSIAAARGDLDAFRESLQALVDAREDQVADHVRYWNTLVAAGRREEAAGLARSYARPPASASECRGFVLLLTRLGEAAEADRMLERGIKEFDDPELWLLRSQLLRQAERWDDLAVLGTTLRTASRWREALGGFGWFVAGYAEQQQGRVERAAAAFRETARAPITVPYFALITASELTRLGYAREADALLDGLREGFADFAPFWHELALAAYRAQRIEDMRDAAAEAYRLDPGNPVFANNLAAALLMLRENTPEALRLTLELRTRRPGSTAARINHALALVQGGRPGDAEVELAGLPDRGLTEVENTMVALARFEAALHEGRRADALRHHAGIRPQHLSPPQKRWLEIGYETLLRSAAESIPSP